MYPVKVIIIISSLLYNSRTITITMYIFVLTSIQTIIIARTMTANNTKYFVMLEFLNNNNNMHISLL